MKLELVSIDVEPSRDKKRYSSRGIKARIYVWEQGESVLDNLMNRRSRPKDLYRDFIPLSLAQMGLPLDTKVLWSQQAGCRCGCSPGFIVQHYYDFYGSVPFVSVTVKWVKEEGD